MGNDHSYLPEAGVDSQDEDAEISTAEILEGALKFTNWVSENVEEHQMAAITGQNPGLQTLIEQKVSAEPDPATLKERRPWNRGKSADTKKRAELAFSLSPRAEDGSKSPPMSVPLSSIDQRLKTRKNPRIPTAVFKESTTNALTEAANGRAHKVNLSKELNVVVLAPIEGVTEERAVIEALVPQLRDLAASRGVYLRHSDLSSPGAKSDDFRSMHMPMVLKAIDEADVVFGVCGSWVGNSFPAAGDALELRGWQRLRDLYPWVNAHKGKSAFEIAVKHATSGSSKKIPSCYFFKDGIQSDDFRDILEDPMKAASVQEMKTLLGEEMPLFTFDSPDDLVAIMLEYSQQFILPMLPKAEHASDAWSREQGAHMSLMRENCARFTPVEDTLDRFAAVVDASQFTCVSDTKGAGKSSLVAKYLERVHQTMPDTKVFTHIVDYSRRSSTVVSVLGQIVINFAPHLVDAKFKFTNGNLVNHLARALREAGEAFKAPMVLAITGLDKIHPEEYFTGMFETKHMAPQSKLLTTTKSIVAISNIFPGDVITRSNVIVITKESAPDALSPILYDLLTNSKAVAVDKIKAGTRLCHQDVKHGHGALSSARVLEMGYGLVIDITHRQHSTSNNIVVAAVVDHSVAKQKGLHRGDIIVSVNDVKMANKTMEEAIACMISSASLNLVLEVPKTGRRHSLDFDWLPQQLPPNLRIIITASDSVCIEKIQHRHKATVTHCDALKPANIEKFVSSEIAAMGDANRKSGGVLSEEQRQWLCHGRSALTSDANGREMFVVTGCGTTKVNGWYRRFEEITPLNPDGLAMFIRKVKPHTPQKKINRRSSVVDMGTQTVDTYYIIKQSKGQGTGWLLRSNLEILYKQTQETVDPPPLNWSKVKELIPDPPPRIVYIHKLATTRTPTLVCRALFDELAPTDPIPQLFLVENAGLVDVNGWFFARKTSDEECVGTHYINYNSPSGKTYVMKNVNSMWFILEETSDPKGIPLYRNTFHFDTAHPPITGWLHIDQDDLDDPSTNNNNNAALMTSIPEITYDTNGNDGMAELLLRASTRSVRTSEMRASSRTLGLMKASSISIVDTNEMNRSTRSISNKSSLDDIKHSSRSLRSLQINTDKHLSASSSSITVTDDMKASTRSIAQEESIRKSLKNADGNGHACPTTSSLIPPNHIPQFLSLVTGDALSVWSDNDRDRVIKSLCGSASIKNLIHFLLDINEDRVKIIVPDVVRKILLLVYFSRAGMLEHELAELCGIADGPWGLPWRCVLATISKLLVCHNGRWNFRHQTIREVVEKRYASVVVMWAHASVQYSYFLTKSYNQQPSNEEDYRVQEELADLHRFDVNVFKSDVQLETKSIQDLKLIGWALQFNQTLYKLDLSKNSIGDRGACMVANGLALNQMLKALTLTDNGIAGEGFVGLAEALEQNTTLERLDLRGNRMDSVGAAAFGAALEINSTLVYLNLDGNNLMCHGATDIAKGLRLNTSLTELILSDNCIAEVGAASLGRSLAKNMTLLRLDLSRNLLGTGGIERFATSLMESRFRLQRLNLSENGAGAESMEPFGLLLRDNNFLVHLNLSGNNIGDEGLKYLLVALSGKEVLRTNRRLERLNISRNGISDLGAKNLFRVIQVNGILRDIMLNGNNITNVVQDNIAKWVKINRKLSVE